MRSDSTPLFCHTCGKPVPTRRRERSYLRVYCSNECRYPPRNPVPTDDPNVFAVPLTGGKTALIDAVDVERVSQFKWMAAARHSKNCERWYAVTNLGAHNGGRSAYLHRFILGAEPDIEVDHQNGDGLDNRRSNLRSASHQQNARNRVTPRGSSGFVGVYRNPGRKWVAQIKVDGRVKYLGSFLVEIDAAAAYDRAAIELFGEFAHLNLPESQRALEMARREDER